MNTNELPERRREPSIEGVFWDKILATALRTMSRPWRDAPNNDIPDRIFSASVDALPKPTSKDPRPHSESNRRRP